MKRPNTVLFLPYIICALLAFAALSGCAAFTRKDAEVPAPGPGADQKFSDIPFPEGFKFVPGSSYIFNSGSARVAVLVYNGRAAAGRVVDFYRGKMAQYSWNLLNVVEYGKYLLNFDRENESCVISVEAKALSTRVVISISPKQ